MLNLTEIWQADGSKRSKIIQNWKQRIGKPIIESVAANNPGKEVIKTKTGSTGGTWATTPIALAYAKWLGESVYLELLNQLFDNSELILDIQGMTEQELVVYILEKG